MKKLKHKDNPLKPGTWLLVNDTTWNWRRGEMLRILADTPCSSSKYCHKFLKGTCRIPTIIRYIYEGNGGEDFCVRERCRFLRAIKTKELTKAEKEWH